MKKRLLSALLTFCMVLTLLPVSALAAPDSGTSAGSSVSTDPDGPVQIHKSVTEDPSGNLSLTLEAYLTNEAEVTYTSTPLDIVLVLDTSGSMDDRLDSYTPVYTLNLLGNYYVLVNGEYQKLDYALLEGRWYYGGFLNRKYVDPKTSADDTNPDHSQVYAIATKMDALRTAVNAFIDQTAETNSHITASEDQHCLAIVTYARSADTPHGLTIVTAETAETMKSTINGLEASGATGADYAMNNVSTILQQARPDAKKVVIFFTDGEPNHGSGFDGNVATSAVNSAYTLKSAQATTIYTIGVMEGANPSDTESNFNRYMNAMSSNYPGAYSQSGWSSLVLGDRATTGNYYMAASSSEELNSVFEQIQDDIQDSLDIVTTQETALTDAMSEMFTFGNAVEADGTGVTVQVLPFAGIDEDGTYLWGSANNEELANQVSVTVDKESGVIKVTGFDYTKNAATITTDAGETTYSGYKLVISFPIQANLDYTGWFEGEHAYPTNKSTSLGPYAQGGETGKSTTLEESPTASVTAYAVTYSWDEEAPSGVNLPECNTYYITGQSHEVDTTYCQGYEVSGTKDGVPGTFTFNGWDQSGTITVNADTTITGSWTFTADEEYTVTYTWDEGPDGINPPAAVSVYEGGSHDVDTSFYVGRTEEGTQNGVPGTYTFNGWDQSGTITVNADTTITGSWTFTADEEYTVTYTWDEGPDGINPPAAVSVYEGGSHDVDTSFYVGRTEEGTQNGVPGTYTFNGWDQSGTITVNADTTITGSWTFTADEEYTVTYTWDEGPDGINPPAAVSVYEGGSHDVDTSFYVGRTEEGTQNGVPGTYTFNGWDQSGTITVNADTTITGSWTFTADEEYTVTYTWDEGPDGINPPAAVSVYEGGSHDVDTSFYVGRTEEGTQNGVPGTYTFNGWDQSGTITVNADTTITGSWTFVEDIPEYQPVNVVIYRNGNTTTPYATIPVVGDYKIGDTISISELKISDYYTEGGMPGEDYVFEGWYNDGGWNDYKAGNPNNTLGEPIIVNGWTNIICMVTDYAPVVVYGVVDGDKDNAEVLYSGEALYGTNVLTYLTENVENLDKDGYTHDEWFKWDAYGTGYKFSETDTVNGWTNVYVAYTSQEQVVQVVIYRNGDMETPYKTVTLDPMNKGDVLDLTTLDINDYYEADKFAERFLYDGWYNDGAWNLYKAGEDVSGLTSITVNGWTNVIAMVWDEFPVNYHILNSDGEELMSVTDYITAENLESYTFYDPTVEAGYTFDGWYEKAEDIGNESKQATLPLILKKYELYGQMDEIAPDQYTIVYHGNGGYVTRNPEKDQTTSTANVGEYITLKNADTFTRKGYVFQGWALSEDGEVAYQGSQKVLDLAGAGESIDLYAVWAEDTTGKTVRIHWSIDNPEGASWTQSENSSWTETIAWSDRYNTFQLPELEVKEGYHLAGWTVSGAQSNYWSAEAHSFGLAGLIVEEENGGYVSITANIVADEPEDPDAGKTLKIYWAIDNPEGASWTQSENSSWTETIAWSDRYNTFQLPELEVKEGYHLAGWTVGGAQSNYWSAEAHSFGLAGLIVEDENGGYVSITANIVADEPEDPDAGKTLKIYWAIDNPEGASWTQSENSSWTETIAWSDRYNTFQLPELEVKEGYHLAGWTVGGAQSNYWSAEAHSFGLAGLIVEDENGGYVSITANIVADEPEDPDAGKTLKIYWAIDNPEGASWTQSENSSWTETIAWSDRYNTFQLPELEVKEGYHLAGWTVGGTQSNYWSAEAHSFGLAGLIVEDENGGYVSITANIVADEPEDPDAGKTLKIYWAIDNPEGASWTQSENSSWTETIAWSDRYNTFQLPELEVKEGYHLAGWTVGGAQSNYWSAEAHSFGLAGLIVEDENGGYVSITANIVADEPEDPDAGKTLKIYWAIDNPEGASWTQSENSSWTETIAWSDRYNTFQLPELEVKEGYHLAGWTVGGAQSNYWSAEAHSFGLAGLIVEDENGGYVSITANIVADEPEDPDAGKTLRIYWAIDNKAGATWTDVGNSEDRTELYSWADRENELGILGVTVNEGYHLSGWTVSGSSSDYWDANTQTFTLNGNYVEDEAGAFLSITANIVADEPEDPDAGKTLRIYWAIDNKAGATWTDVGNSEDRTELYSWADRENELGILGVTVNEGYHLAGWTVSGSSSDYWDANTQTFTLNGNYVEDEAGAFLSITANIVADEPEDPDAGKTLRIYWAIDNKAGATWTDVGNSEDRTELYSWADRENELGILGVTVNEDYRLAGWTVSGDTSTYLDADTTSFTLDGNYVADENGGFLSITANIVADEPDEETFTVTFDSNGGSSVNAQTVESGKTVAKPADPTRNGYDFEGWFTDEDLTIEYDFDTPVTADITLYAAWDKQNSGGGGGGGSDTETYAVYYHSNYGSDERKFGGRYEENDEVEVRDNSWWDRDNYRFLGWNTEEDGSGQDYDPEDTFDMPDEDVHLYAQWRRMASDPSESGTDRWLNTSNHISYLTGYPGSIFGPDNSMTRAEVAQMFYALLNDQNVTITKTFPDVPADAWYATAVNTLGTLGMVTGDSKGNFNPNDPITRAEFCAVALAFAYEPEDYDCSFYDVSRSDWFYPYVAQASTYGWIGGYTSGNFGPNDQITRAQVTTIVNNMLGRAADEDYVDEYWDELVQFNDLSDNHWAYYQIMEATNEHDYTKSNGMENWER